MNKVRKAIAIFATMAMILSLSIASAFAAPIGTGVATSGDTQLTIPKGVTFINKGDISSYGPGITYTYTVAPAALTDGAITVTDADNHRSTVHSGPAAGLTLGTPSITFAASELFTATSAGTEATKNIVLNVDITKFDRAGVYRYVLTDTTATSALFDAGVTRKDDYSAARYIDVFIKRNTTTGAMEVAGYALKLTNDSTDGTATPPTAKDPGYVQASAAEGANGTDRYETYNLTLTKQVAGAYGDTEHEFPFAITVSNQSKAYFAGEGTTAETSATSLTGNLKHGETYTINALSPKATIAYQETNDTTDLYAVTVAGSSEAIPVTADATAKTYAVGAANVSTYPSNSATSVAILGAETNFSDVTYTNTLEEVSPTGFVQHYGLLLAMMITAVMLIFATRTTEDEEL